MPIETNPKTLTAVSLTPPNKAGADKVVAPVNVESTIEGICIKLFF